MQSPGFQNGKVTQVSVGEKPIAVLMLDHPLAFLWALLGALIMKEVSLKELSQLISFIQKTTKTLTVSNTDFSYLEMLDNSIFQKTFSF